MINERVALLAAELRSVVSSLNLCDLPSSAAVELVESFASIEKLGGAGRTLAAARVIETRAWYGSGARSATEWMAARTGTTFGAAADSLRTAARIADLPETRKSLIAGELSNVQAAEICEAATVDPTAEQSLLSIAARETVATLKERCADVRAAAIGDEDANERIRRSRYFKNWIDRDGAVRLDARLAPDDAAPLLAAVRVRADELMRQARASGQREPVLAYAADALVSLADGVGAPKAIVNVLVSRSALARGHTVAGETCRIDGVAPVIIGSVKRMVSSSDVRIIETDGVDVTRVANAGRMIAASVRRALEARDTSCVVPGCHVRHPLEIDHVVPFASGGKTELANLARLCRWHHAQKTHHGWRLEGAPGSWRFVRAPRARAGSDSGAEREQSRAP